jgi:hypothetical protein
VCAELGEGVGEPCAGARLGTIVVDHEALARVRDCPCNDEDLVVVLGLLERRFGGVLASEDDDRRCGLLDISPPAVSICVERRRASPKGGVGAGKGS